MLITIAFDAILNFQQFLVEPKAIKGLLFGIILGWLTQFPGGIAFLNYAVIIFEKSGASPIDPYISSIILAVAQLFGCFFSTKLADSLGRKLMMIISFMGCAIGLFVFALYLYLNQNGYDLSVFSWLPVASLSFIMFIASAGVYTLYSVCFVEYLPTKVCKIPSFLISTVIFRWPFFEFSIFARLFSDSNYWIDNMCVVAIFIIFYICQGVSICFRIHWSLRMHDHFYGWKCCWCTICYICSSATKC